MMDLTRLEQCDSVRFWDRRSNTSRTLSIREQASAARSHQWGDTALEQYAERQCPFTARLPLVGCIYSNSGLHHTLAAGTGVERLECTAAELDAHRATRRFGQAAQRVDDGAAYESLLARLPAAPVAASPSARGYCREVSRGSGNCSSGDQGSWGVAEQSEAETEKACLRLCAGCARCRYVSYSHAMHDCGWFHACRLGSLQTNVDGFVTRRVTAAPTTREAESAMDG